MPSRASSVSAVRGLRRYAGAKEMPKVQNGLGIAIVSTPKDALSQSSVLVRRT